MPMMEIVLNLVVLRSADLGRAAGFYGLLGLEFARERHGSGPEHLICQLGPVVLEIYPQEGGKNTAALRVGFRVPSVDVALAAVRSAGGTVLSPAKDGLWGSRAVLVDPDGHRVEITEARGA
jgi:predicted enzyme related to lactoylglutathione lyase